MIGAGAGANALLAAVLAQDASQPIGYDRNLTVCGHMLAGAPRRSRHNEMHEHRGPFGFPGHIMPMSDSDFTEHLSARIRSEQEIIDAQIAAGATFIRSGIGKIHTLTCRHSGHYPSRRDAYTALCPDPAHMQHQLAHGGPPPMPNLLTKQKIATQTAKYERCRTCTPQVPDFDDRQRQPRSTSELITALKAQVDKFNTRAHAALLATLQMHYAPIGHSCPTDGRSSPCPTTTTILRAYGIKP